MRALNEDDVCRLVEEVINDAIEKKQNKSTIQKRIICGLSSLNAIPNKSTEYGEWILKERTVLVPTGKYAVAEGHCINYSAGSVFTLDNNQCIIKLRTHKLIRKPYCSKCGEHGDDEYDMTPYCPNCGIRMVNGVMHQINNKVLR